MSDTNISVKMLALGIISKIATGMGPPFDKQCKVLTSAVASVCADQKATTRTAGIATLTAMADACGSLDAMYSGLGTALDSPNPALRSSVLAWLAERLKADPPPKGTDMQPLAGPIISCLEDRNGDVRKGAGVVLPFVVQHAGYDFVMDQTSSLKPASKATIVPLINNAKAAAAPAPTAAASSKATSTPVTGPSKMSKPPFGAARAAAPDSPKPAASGRAIGAPVRSLAMNALAPTSRPASSISSDHERPTGLQKPRSTAVDRPTSTASHVTSISAATSSGRIIPFISKNVDARAGRVKKDTARWLLDASPKSDMPEYLATQMEPHTAPEVFSLLFSKDHRAEEDFMAGLSAMAEFFDPNAASIYDVREDELAAIQLANVDLALKYSALKLLSNNTQMAIRCIELISHVVGTMQTYNERFSDPEAKLFVPALIMKVGDCI